MRRMVSGPELGHQRCKILVGVLALVLALIGLRVGLGMLARHRIETRWAQVQVGMSRDEVEALLGSPANVYAAGVPQSNSVVGSLLVAGMLDSLWEKWAYGRRRLFAFQPKFPFVGLALDGFLLPEPNDYVVYFSAEG